MTTIKDKSDLRSLNINEVRALYKEKFPGKPLRRTKAFFIKELERASQKQTIQEDDLPAEYDLPEEVQDIKKYYKQHLGVTTFNRVDKALNDMPEFSTFDKEWKTSITYPWEEYNRELLIIDDTGTEDDLVTEKQTLLNFDKNLKFGNYMVSFAKKYPLVTWVEAYVGSKLATTAMVAIIDEWNILYKLKDSFSASAVIRAKTEDISSEIYRHITHEILPKNKKEHDKLYPSIPIRHYFNIILLELAAHEDNFYGMRLALDSNAVIMNKYDDRELIKNSIIIMLKHDYFEGFDLWFRYLSDELIVEVMGYASSRVIRYIFDRYPELFDSFDDIESIFKSIFSTITREALASDIIDILDSVMLWKPSLNILGNFIYWYLDLSQTQKSDIVVEYFLLQGIFYDYVRDYIPFDLDNDKIIKLYINNGGNFKYNIFLQFAKRGFVKGLKALVDGYNVEEEEEWSLVHASIKWSAISSNLFSDDVNEFLKTIVEVKNLQVFY